MPRFPGVPHQQAIKAFQKAGFVVVRQSGHVVMKRDQTIWVIPRHNPMGELIRVAGLTPDEFSRLLR